jgi:plasmid maintenance system antidote protein VapI
MPQPSGMPGCSAQTRLGDAVGDQQEPFVRLQETVGFADDRQGATMHGRPGLKNLDLASGNKQRGGRFIGQNGRVALGQDARYGASAPGDGSAPILFERSNRLSERLAQRAFPQEPLAQARDDHFRVEVGAHARSLAVAENQQSARRTAVGTHHVAARLERAFGHLGDEGVNVQVIHAGWGAPGWGWRNSGGRAS